MGRSMLMKINWIKQISLISVYTCNSYRQRLLTKQNFISGPCIRRVVPYCTDTAKDKIDTGCSSRAISVEKHADYCLLRGVYSSDQEFSLPLNYLWLRDHCRCSECYSTTTFQRTADGLALDLNTKASNIDVGQSSKELHVKWHDGHQSVYAVPWLLEHTYEGRRLQPPAHRPLSDHRELWDGARAVAIPFPRVEASELLASDQALTAVLRSLMTYGLAFVHGCEASVGGTERVCSRVAHHVTRTMFGTMWSFTSDGARSDTAYTDQALAPHTDTTYLSQPAGVQVFQLLSHTGGAGGETVLVDGFHCAARLRAAHPTSHSALSTHDVCGEYRESGGEHRYHTTGHGPVLLHDDVGDIVRIRYNPYDRAPLSSVPAALVGQHYAAYRHLSQLVLAPEARFTVPLRPGTVLLIDNWRVLHGREAFTGRRTMCGAYLDRDYLVSRWRTHHPRYTLYM